MAEITEDMLSNPDELMLISTDDGIKCRPVSTGCRKACDDGCPSTGSDEAQNVQNLGCLPCPGDIAEMVKRKEVWMCHSNPRVPCAIMNMPVLPLGHIAETDRDYCPIDTQRETYHA